MMWSKLLMRGGFRKLNTTQVTCHQAYPKLRYPLQCVAHRVDSLRLVSTCNVQLVKVYTKTGDSGTSALFTGERRLKNDMSFEALGTIDELSSYLAVAREFATESKHDYVTRLERIQCILQDLSSLVATPHSSARKAHTQRVVFSIKHTSDLEEWIDEYTAGLPPLENFIIAGGGRASAALHVARTICRRAERCVAPLVKAGETDKEALIYLNRLSDFLFTVARVAAKLDKREETIYIRPDA